MADFQFDPAGQREFETSMALRQALEKAGFIITAHAIPHTGVDTGRLVNSMGHSVEIKEGTAVLHVGSGVQDGVEPVWYALPHWGGVADKSPEAQAAAKAEPSRKKHPHPTKPGPTRPYTKAFDEVRAALGLVGPAKTADGVDI